MELLRGPAHREREAALRARPLPGLQGHLPALPRDDRQAGAAQGRLGLPRPAGRAGDREGAGPLQQGRDRGVRDRRVQRQVPRVGLPLRRGLEAAERADRLLDRHGRPLRDDGERLHRVGLVGAAADLGRRAALRGPQGRPVLPALRHRALLARGRAGLPRRRGPLRVPEAANRPADPQRRDPREPASGRGSASGLDDDPLDADHQRGRRGRPRHRIRQGQARGRGVRAGSGARRGRARRGGRGPRALPRRGAGRDRATSPPSPTSPTTGPGATRSCSAISSARTREPAWSTPRSPSARTTSGWASSTGSRCRTRSSWTAPSTSASPTSPAAPSRRPTPTSSRRWRRRGSCCAPRPTCTAIRTAGAATRRSSTTRSRAGTWRRARSRTGCWPPTRRSAGTPSTSSTAASASGWRTTSTGRSAATATGGPRCRSGSARAPTATGASAPGRSRT